MLPTHVVLTVVLSLLIVEQSSAKISRPLPGFNYIRVYGGVFQVTVDFSQGNRGLEIDTDDQATLDLIETTVQNQILTIQFREGTRVTCSGSVSIAVHTTSLYKIDVSGTSSVVVLETMAANSAELLASGAAAISVELAAAQLVLVGASGTARITISGGTADRATADLQGSSKLLATPLRARTATIETAGVSEASMSVSESLTAIASGASSIRYVGSPAVDRRVSGVATVTQITGRAGDFQAQSPSRLSGQRAFTCSANGYNAANAFSASLVPVVLSASSGILLMILV